MNTERGRPSLRLIHCHGDDTDAKVVSLDNAAERADARRALIAEAEALEAELGKNPYSDYVLGHGRRPPPKETAGMGRVMNLRLRAADGSLQPKRTAADKIQCKRWQAQKKARQRVTDNARLLRGAVNDLAAINMTPAQLVECLESTSGRAIREHLERALEYLSRFAGDWRRHHATRRPKRSP